MKTIILLISLLLFNCLKATRSPFDISSPSGAIGSGIVFSFDSAFTKPDGSSTTYTIGGNITGFTSGTLVLQLNGGVDVSLTPVSSYQIGSVGANTTYTVTIKTNPAGFTCTIANGSGTATANVTNADITCTTGSGASYTIGGNIAGFTSGTLVLQLNGGVDVSLTPVSSYQIGSIGANTTYTVTIKTNPVGFTCTIANGSGTATANVTNADITCTATAIASYTIGGTISGLSSGTLVLRNNGSDDLNVNAGASSFQFASSVTSGSTYSVSIQSQPSGLSCSIANATGTAGANVTNVTITCSAITYTVSGTISGLSSGALVVQNNGGNDLNISASSTSFQFTSAIASNSSYAVTILTQPSGLTCSVSGGNGTISANVTNVVITCSTTTYTIGGTITGLTTGTLIVQNNGANDLSIISGATSFLFTTAIAHNSAYSVTVKQHPIGLVCTLTNTTGTATGNVTNVGVSCAVAVVSPLYTTNGRNWNDYVDRPNTSSDIFSQVDTPCGTANTGGYRTCVHGGEIRKFDLPSRSSCTNLTGSDSAGALNWICKPNGSGGVTFYSSGLKKGKYLSDLIDWATNDWKSLTFTVTENTTTHLQTQASTAWWSNGTPLLNTTAVVQGKIHLFTNTVSSFSISAGTDKVAIVFRPNAIFGFTNGDCSVTNAIDAHSNFNWFEGSINANGFSTGLLLNTKFSVAKNLKIQNAGGGCSGSSNAILISGAMNNYLEDIVGANISNTSSTNSAIGFYITNSSSYNILNQGITYNSNNTASGGIGLQIDSSSTKNTIIGILSFNNSGSGVSVSTNDSTLINLSSSNNSSVGFSNGGGQNLLSMNMAMINNGTNGLFANPFNFGTFQNIASANNASNELNIQSTSSSSSIYFTGVLKVSTANCVTSGPGGSSFGILAPSCNKANLSDFNNANAGNVILTSITSASTIYGSTLDSLNSQFNSTLTLPCNTVTDWLKLSNFFRGIGREYAAGFPGANTRGRSTTNCNIWDWSLKSTDSELRNVNMISGTSCPTGNSTFTHTWSAVGATQAICSSNYPGSLLSGGTCVTTILRNSVEIINDGVGNDNGICESNEDCLVTPNIGAYQGHGNIVSASTATTPATNNCSDIVTGGTIQNVKLYKYETNGY